MERKQGRGPQLARWQKVPLAMLAVRLKARARSGRTALEASKSIEGAGDTCAGSPENVGND